MPLAVIACRGHGAGSRASRGGQPIYADMAIEVVLTLIFHLATAPGRRLHPLGSAIAWDADRGAQPIQPSAGAAVALSDANRVFSAMTSPSTSCWTVRALQIFGQGEWDAEKHGRKPRRWRKLHLAVDAETGEIVAHILTDKDGGDITHVPALLATVEGRIASVTADGAYDDEAVYREASARQHDPPVEIVIPPRSSSVVTSDAENQTIRDLHVQFIAEKGRMAWQKAAKLQPHWRLNRWI